MVAPDRSGINADRAPSAEDAPLSSQTCAHERAYTARRKIASGVAPWLLCPDCGHSRALKKIDHPDLNELPEFDENVRERIWDQNHQLWSEKHEREREERHQKWWDEYNAYLASPEWLARRRKVLTRAQGLCEACLERPATQVHHTSYKHVRNEPLFELRAVCTICHEQITELDRK